MKNRILFLLAGVYCSILALDAHAQSLLGSNPPLPPIHARVLAWADYDLDGDLDLLVCGDSSGSVPRAMLLRNDVTAFVPANMSFPAMEGAAGAWGDYDNDGDEDLLLCGRLHGRGHSQLWRNDPVIGIPGARVFVAMPDVIPGVQQGCLKWADLDGDGDLDAFISGHNYDRGYVSVVLRNQPGTSGGRRLVEVSSGIEGFCSAVVALGDLNGDSLPDIVISGHVMLGEAKTDVYMNAGGLGFVLGASLGAMPEGSASLGDMDQDGDLDLLASGASRPYALGLWRNDAMSGNGVSLNGTSNLTVPGIVLGDAQWSDWDNDGIQEFVYCGTEQGGAAVARAMHGLGGGLFTDQQPSDPILGLHSAKVSWADWNGDGHADFALSGMDSSGQGVSVLYRWDVLSNKFVH